MGLCLSRCVSGVTDGTVVGAAAVATVVAAEAVATRESLPLGTNMVDRVDTTAGVDIPEAGGIDTAIETVGLGLDMDEDDDIVEPTTVDEGGELLSFVLLGHADRGGHGDVSTSSDILVTPVAASTGGGGGINAEASKRVDEEESEDDEDEEYVYEEDDGDDEDEDYIYEEDDDDENEFVENEYLPDDANDLFWEEEQHYYERRFELLCENLRKNDPTEIIANVVGVEGYAFRLCQALEGNTHVTELELRLTPEEMHGLNDNQQQRTESSTMLLQYMRDSPYLQLLLIFGGTLECTGSAMQAVAQNPAIQKLYLLYEGTELPHEELATLLRTTNTLKDLHLPLLNDVGVAEAIAANQTLSSLRLTFDPNATPAQNGVILSRLHSHPTLRHLTMIQLLHSMQSSEPTVDEVLTTYLSQNSQLTTFELMNQRFDNIRVHHLIEGLKANESITILIVHCCEFDETATAELKSFVECDTLSNTFSSIRELDLHSIAIPPDVAAYLVLACCQVVKFVWTWPGLESPVSAIADFWRILDGNASRVSVREMRQDPCCSDSCEAMFTCIPKLVFLEKLDVHMGTSICSRPTVRRHAVETVWQSGSLTSASLEWPGTWSVPETNILQAACTRNQMLPQMLPRPAVDVRQQEEEDQHDSDEPPLTEVPMYPPLFHSAMQAPRKSPSSLLSGLLALSEDIS